MTHKEIQDEVIKKYRVKVYDTCPMGCRMRTHAHVKKRTVCKWKRANGIKSTFTLLHEIGHLETTTGKMRRCEEEYYATIWALERCKEYGLEVPDQIITRYQNYINREKDRGLRRGGSGYPANLSITKFSK